MSYKTIEEYNNYLIDNQIIIQIIDYVKEVNKLKFNMDIFFIDEFIDLVDKNECCIHHDMIQKYGVLKLNKGTTDIKNLISQNDFIENEDFRLRNVSESASKGGCTHKKEYYFHPRSFKKCLMRSKNTKIYADYYLLLEECIKYFNDYQIKLKDTYIIKLKTKLIRKDNKIDHLEEKLNTIIKNNEKLINQNEDLLKSNKIMQESLTKANYKLDETLEKLDEVHEELENTNTELEDTNEKLDTTDKTLKIVVQKLDIAVVDRVLKTKSKLKNESFILMFNPNETYKYKVIRAKKEYVNTRIDKLKNENYVIVESINNVPNASTLWCLIKEELKDKIDSCGNRLNLTYIDELQFKIKINDIYNKRKNVII